MILGNLFNSLGLDQREAGALSTIMDALRAEFDRASIRDIERLAEPQGLPKTIGGILGSDRKIQLSDEDLDGWMSEVDESFAESVRRAWEVLNPGYADHVIALYRSLTPDKRMIIKRAVLPERIRGMYTLPESFQGQEL
ncbi:MAG: hypothetical protein GC137_05285 [Alphaproteobacteria bacterium]|nr:hypothetical protein [Alphaproteobacteria bacterium]